MRQTQCTTHCWVGLTTLVLAAASSGVGERQGDVNGVRTMMEAGIGKVWQVLRLELPLVFLEEESVMKHNSVSISLSF